MSFCCHLTVEFEDNGQCQQDNVVRQKSQATRLMKGISLLKWGKTEQEVHIQRSAITQENNYQIKRTNNLTRKTFSIKW